MRKGIIMEVHHDKAIVMNERGQFDEIKATSGMYVGREIEYGDHSAMKVAATLCMLLVMIGGIFGFNYHVNQTTPVSYVAVDINPGVEFTVNVYDRIINASPKNQEGKLVLAGIDYNGEDIQTAVENFVNEATSLGFIDQGNDNAVLITVVNDDNAKAYLLQDKLVARVNHFFVENQILGIVLTEESNTVMKSVADSHGMSVGKYRLAQQAAKENESLSVEEASQMPVKELNKIINNSNDATASSDLLAQKQTQQDSVAEKRKVRMPEKNEIEVAAFGGVLADYQNQIDEEQKQKIWAEVIENEVKKECTNLETNEAIVCPTDQKICVDEEKNIRFVCPLNQTLCLNKENGNLFVCPKDVDICVDQEGNHFVCPLDQDICFDEVSNTKFVCPVDQKICIDEQTKHKFVCPFQGEEEVKDENKESATKNQGVPSEQTANEKKQLTDNPKVKEKNNKDEKNK